ncbi:MAG: tRNA lysidine(34) synthetase TilS [Candidatus Omnitrophica bacterium]|nr:tRNA lysidine(34) synthetase TilS [Candidatus Omnitrophota bacterium]
MEAKIINKIEGFINRHNLINIEKTYVLAVSGGPDSVFLMDALLKIYKNNKTKFIVAYIHHGLRKESDKELQFVKKLTSDYGFPFYYRKVRIKKQKGKSIENEARKKRYKALKELAEKKRCAGIITGHTLDDQAETIFLNMLRGSGLTGICGMPPKIEIEKDGHLYLIRPLLFTLRENISKYLKEKNLKFKLDRSNFDLKYRRNYIRHKIFPVIEKINPGFKKVLGRLSFILQADENFIKNRAEYFYNKSAEKSKDNIIIDFKKFTILPLALQREIIKTAIGELIKSKYSPPFIIIEEIREKIIEKKMPMTIQKLSVNVSYQENKIYIHKFKK